MSDLHSGAKQLMPQHLSARVAWHDTAWDGRVCAAPSHNTSCLVLPRVHEARDDVQEDEDAGTSWAELRPQHLPPCVAERTGFLRPYELRHVRTHPYVHNSSHQHLNPTALPMPPYSVMAVPYRWMLRGEAAGMAETYDLGYAQELEDRADEIIGWDSAWVQDGRNQRVMLDTFFSALTPEQSLVFFYAKRVPFVEHSPGHRVLIGVGHVTTIGQPVEWSYDVEGPIRTWLWERAIGHSIREGSFQGFVMPYHALQEHLGVDTDLSPYAVFAPEEHWDEYSYGSELVTHDGAIASLLALVQGVERIRNVVDGPWTRVLAWLDERLNETWRARGPAPGLGSALVAFGVERGTMVAHRLLQNLSDNTDPWPALEQAFHDAPEGRGPAAGLVHDSHARAFHALPDQRRKLLQLLARFSLNADQATRFYRPERRTEHGLSISDSDILGNPYVLYEADRSNADPIRVTSIDRGVFPDDVVRSQHPLPIADAIDDPQDKRRVRALATSVLEGAADLGSTVLPRDALLRSVQELGVSPACELTSDLLPSVEPFFADVIRSASSGDAAAFQLERLANCGALIRRTVTKRLKARPHIVEAEWRRLVNEAFGALPEGDDERADEERARQEKVTALEELATSRFSVLVGPAGTGKTRLLQILLDDPSVHAGGVVLLAPTGKARVQLQEATKRPAQTLAQFLLALDRYDPDTGGYVITGSSSRVDAGTVVIDEASMLTEEQLAATLDAVRADRIILVGDTRQLPPIGAGRPFVDTVRHCQQQGRGYAALTVHRRQVGVQRDDLDLAAWFTSGEQPPGVDDVWARVAAHGGSETVELVSWHDEGDLEKKLFAALAELGVAVDKPNSLELSLGATENRGNAYFNPGAAEQAESWQILAPLRGGASGVIGINRLIQRQFRSQMLEFAREKAFVPKPVGSDEIVYGDKVMCLNNHRRQYWSREEGKVRGYIANGEIGLMIGRFKKRNERGRPRFINVEFTSQPGRSYTFYPGNFGESDPLELAYAVTVHKSQGSQFGVTILVIPNPCPLLSPELLYTALTRQQDRVIVLHQGDIADLKPYTAPHASETARRLTNVFTEPQPTEIQGQPLDANLIHRTVRGEAVRSKSELVIANLLAAADVEYQYERPFVGDDGTVRWPDFTIEDVDTGETYLWEHLGMLHLSTYRRRWERKLAWYRSNGIVPIEGGGGSRGALVTTRDDDAGGLDSRRVRGVIDELWATG